MRRKQQYFKTEPNDPIPVSVEVRHRLAFSEVDALAIAWHGHYPRFFEMGHSALMRKVGLTYENYRKFDIGAPIVQCHADYYKPLLLDEEFTIRAELFWSEGARLNVGYTLIKPNGEISGTGYTTQMFFNAITHEPFIFTPPLVEDVFQKWQDGKFYD